MMSGVVWITGLSGAGKTTTARMMRERLVSGSPVIHLDGDELRRIMAGGSGFARADRVDLGIRYFRLAQCLETQGALVLLSAIAMFREVEQFARESIKKLAVIVLRPPMETLRERDVKRIYSSGAGVGPASVAGVDFAVDWPETPDLVLDNAQLSPAEVADSALAVLRRRGFLQNV